MTNRLRPSMSSGVLFISKRNYWMTKSNNNATIPRITIAIRDMFVTYWKSEGVYRTEYRFAMRVRVLLRSTNNNNMYFEMNQVLSLF